MTASFRSKNIDRVHMVRLVLCLMLGASLSAQTQAPQPVGALGGVPPAAVAAAPRATDPVVPPGYVIGTDDVLSIVYWKDKDMSADAKVRPDGRIALPLINE